MDYERFKEKVIAADNDSLLRSLIDYAKKMDSDLESYEAIKILKDELLKRLEGEEVEQEEKVWRKDLTDVEKEKVIELYECGYSIGRIQFELADGNISHKAIRILVAERFGKEIECVNCGGKTLHVAFKKDDRVTCIECGKIKF